MGTVTENFQAAFDLAIRVNGQVRELWINDGRQFLKNHKVESLFYQDVIVRDDQGYVVFTCDASLLVRVRDMPRKPEPTELLFYPRNTSWQIAQVKEAEGIYEIFLNRARSPRQ